MCGYKDERYKEFGWASARMDDLANLIPARLSAALVWICALLPGFSARRAVLATLRDAGTQPSPNSGYPEAAFAGALGVRLGGLNFYRGVPSKKNYLGEPVRPLSRRTFQSARILLYGASILMVAITCAVLA
jgi:adenosylcobinamide-phosphate synthase